MGSSIAEWASGFELPGVAASEELDVPRVRVEVAQSLLNDAVVRLGVLEGEFHWHKHGVEDEFFLVLEGELVIETQGSETVRLHPHQGFTVPRGVMHKTSAPERTVIVMVEPAGCPHRRLEKAGPAASRHTSRVAPREPPRSAIMGSLR